MSSTKVKEDSPFIMSDEDTTDSLEIKPPQASVFKVHHKSHKDRHSSRRSHSNTDKSSSSGQHRSSSSSRHHSGRHKDERERKHHHKEKERKRDRSTKEAYSEEKKHAKERESYKNHKRRLAEEEEEERIKYKEEKRNRVDNSKEYERIEMLKAQEAELRARLERKKHHSSSNPFKDKEKLERELRKERLLEAERVKEAYKERVKDVEQKRKRYKTRSSSRSPVKSKKGNRSSPAASKSKKMSEADSSLVVLTDESKSPTPQRNPDQDNATEDQEMKDNQSEDSEKDSTASEDDSSSSSDENDEHSNESSADSNDDKKSPQHSPHQANNLDSRESSPHVVVSTNEMDLDMDMVLEKDTLPPYLPAIQGCRSVEEFKCLNRIEEGTYGVVYRAKDKRTEEIVALKKLKMEKEKEGFPITSLREINTLLKAQHPNIVTVREIVVGSNMDKIFIVMDYVEHDMKSLMETMRSKKQEFVPGEVKCLMQQLLQAVAHLHDNWILHRDLKTSNLLLSHKGILKVGDFGLAREYGSPLKHYTPIVVTLWYRSPELILGCKEYSTHIDIWSVGCIFSEFLRMEPLFPGKSDIDQLTRIFKTLGTPDDTIWPGYSDLPVVQKITFSKYPNTGALQIKHINEGGIRLVSEAGFELLEKFLTYDPKQRITAEEALKSEYFKESPLPIDPSMFPTWPAKSELGHKKAMSSPKPPSGGQKYKQLEDNEEGFHMGLMERSRNTIPGFSLKF